MPPILNTSAFDTALAELEVVNDAFTKAIVTAFTSLQAVMKEKGVKKIKLHDKVHYVDNEGDYHSAYVAVALDDDQNLVAIDELGEEVPWQEIGNDTSYSILYGVGAEPAGGQLRISLTQSAT